MSILQIMSGGLALLWLFLTCFLPHRAPAGQSRSLAAMIVIGVPVLGWLTLHWGPGVGLCAFAAGLAAILHRNRSTRNDKSDAHDDGAILPE